MPLLSPAEYDASYFDGASQAMRHNAGYSRYSRWYRSEGEGSTGEYWADYALELLNEHSLHNLRVLEIGCAKGFLVEELNNLGVECHGIDASAWCINNAGGVGVDGIAIEPAATIRRPDLASRFSVGDARTALADYRNRFFDVVFSLRFIECVSDADLPALVSEMNRISRRQFHVIDEQPNAAFYTARDIDAWADSFAWATGTRLASNERDYVRAV